LTQALTPVSTITRNPLNFRADETRVVLVGTRIRDLAPTEFEGLLVCRYNGEWLLREHWDERVQFGDRVEWFDYPQGREGVRLLLAVAIVVASIFYQPAVPYLVAANAAYNLLVPPRQQGLPNQPPPASGVFSASLAGNAARLDQPIWRNFGRVKITPPFASNPYTEFRAHNATTPTVDCDQYYFAVFCLGIGDKDIEKAFIDKTSILHFKDILVSQYLAPGVQPSQAKLNVVTSDEVSSALTLDTGAYVGGYAACRPGDLANYVSVDVGASQGLGSSGSLTMTWQVEIRQINDYGAPVGSWTVLGSESRTGFTNTPQRWTSRYTVAVPMRCEIRVVRTDVKSTDPSARHSLEWIGLRAEIQTTGTLLNQHAAHYEVVMRASDQLSAFSQKDFSMIVREKVRTWSPGGGWAAATFTRNAAWALAELWSSDIWGEGQPDERIDLATLYAWSVTLDARQDHFDYSFTTAVDSAEASQLIARSGRARTFRRAGVYTLARDEWTDVPFMAMTPRNTLAKSMKLSAGLPNSLQPDGVIVEYQDQVTWDTKTIECPCPGFTVTSVSSPRYNGALPMMSNPVYLPLEGIQGAYHAEREGLYLAYDMALRQTKVKAKMEMEGQLLAYLDTCLWQPLLSGYGQAGDVAYWNATTLVMGLTEKPDWTQGSPLYLILQRKDGTLTDAVAVTPGPTDFDVQLLVAPDFNLVLDSGLQERPKFLLGLADSSSEIVKVQRLTDGGNEDGVQFIDVDCVIDDERVHTADNFLLPGPGVVQDPIDDGADSGGGGVIVIPTLTAKTVESGTNGGSAGTAASLTFNNDGSVSVTSGSLSAGSNTGQWNIATITSAQAGLYEIRFTVQPIYTFIYLPDQHSAHGTSNAALSAGSAAAGSWLALSTNRKIEVDNTMLQDGLGVITAKVLAEIRETATGIVQASAMMSLAVWAGTDI
jgi:hypothetical protein